MTNNDLQAAWAYHNGTKHSDQSIRSNPHFLDWETQPIPFKIYPRLEPIALPQALASTHVAALRAIAAPSTGVGGPPVLTTQTLAEVFHFSAGITKRARYPGGEIYFRAAACTGALYHIDLYLVCADLPDLASGVYHFGPHDFALRRLRHGDYRAFLAQACGEEPHVSSAPAVIVCASTYWRNAWKYQSRAYRHCFWDNGTILANLLAVAVAHGLPAHIVLGFVDSEVSRFLGLDDEREGVISVVPLGYGPGSKPPPAPPVEALALETQPLSKSEVDYPAIRAMHAASSLEDAAEVVSWRARAPRFSPAMAAVPSSERGSQPRVLPLSPPQDDAVPHDALEEVIRRRGSTREFAREPISLEQLSTILDRATRGVPTDFSAAKGPALNHLYLIVNAVDGLAPGAYVYQPEASALELLKAGTFRRDAGHLGLGQEIPADAAVDVFFLTDLQQVLERWGNRGYRAAQLEAAVMGGKLYLAAYAQGLGASGLTFFDDDVTEFFSPHAAGKSVMFLIALGKSAKRRVR
ncbi:MAG: SagB/ThcOx family dehydrogenase [Deltaproteobacteria bacterium]|nr:SagB/ThcOx family dehydrogenase [Deltaproteobacteria bacterium]